MRYWYTLLLPTFLMWTPLQSQEDSTDIMVRLLLLNLVDIDDNQEAVFAEFILDATWRQPGVRDTILRLGDSRVPRLQIRNLLHVESIPPDDILVDSSGVAHYTQRVVGSIQQRFDFGEFPYDRQYVDIEIFAIGNPAFRIRADTVIFNGITPGFEDLTAWDINFEGVSSSELSTPDRSISAVTYRYALDRHATYYFWKVLLPVTLIVFMSWGAFWISPEEISAQLTVSVTAILTLIALQFSVSQLVPPLSYLTYLDKFSAGANFFVFLAFLQSIITSYQSDAGRVRLSQRIDRVSRVMFPAAFGLFLLLIH